VSEGNAISNWVKLPLGETSLSGLGAPPLDPLHGAGPVYWRRELSPFYLHAYPGRTLLPMQTEYPFCIQCMQIRVEIILRIVLIYVQKRVGQ
jgi:hypothetical protein